jgi:hypothetical protein
MSKFNIGDKAERHGRIGTIVDVAPSATGHVNRVLFNDGVACWLLDHEINNYALPLPQSARLKRIVYWAGQSGFDDPNLAFDKAEKLEAEYQRRYGSPDTSFLTNEEAIDLEGV